MHFGNRAINARTTKTHLTHIRSLPKGSRIQLAFLNINYGPPGWHSPQAWLFQAHVHWPFRQSVTAPRNDTDATRGTSILMCRANPCPCCTKCYCFVNLSLHTSLAEPLRFVTKASNPG